MRLLLLGILTTLIALSPLQTVLAADQPDGSFSIQVSPSPLVQNVTPGKLNDLEIRVRNAGDQVENLRIQPRSFQIDGDSGSVKLDDATPPEVSGWLSFSSPNFTIQPGEVFTQHLRVNVPKDAGFSYSFALVINRQRDPNPTEGNRVIKASLAIFTLLNVNRQGAVRKLEISQLTASKRVYEYLPTQLSVKFKNTGNTIVQPYGDIFIQRGDNKQPALSTLPVNEKRGYILPGSTRTLDTAWNDGFPVVTTSTGNDGKTTSKLDWNWRNLDNFRIGKYTARVVAVYNDGSRDVPLEGSVSFWVFPWKIIGGAVLIILLFLLGIGSLLWRFVKLGRKAPKKSA